jgi:hypothetical protein
MKQVVIKNLVPKPVRPGDCLLSRMFPSRPHGGLSLRGVTRHEDTQGQPMRKRPAELRVRLPNHLSEIKKAGH